MKKIPISFNFDEDIFWLFVSLNLSGYDDENNKNMHPLRREIRKNLTSYQKNNQNLNNLKLLYSKKHQSYFVEWIIQKKYNKKITSGYSSTELDFFKNFDSILSKFIVSVKKEKIFSKAKKIYLEEKENEYQNINKNLNKLINTLNAVCQVPIF